MDETIEKLVAFTTEFNRLRRRAESFLSVVNGATDLLDASLDDASCAMDCFEEVLEKQDFGDRYGHPFGKGDIENTMLDLEHAMSQVEDAKDAVQFLHDSLTTMYQRMIRLPEKAQENGRSTTVQESCPKDLEKLFVIAKQLLDHEPSRVTADTEEGSRITAILEELNEITSRISKEKDR